MITSQIVAFWGCRNRCICLYSMLSKAFIDGKSLLFRSENLASFLSFSQDVVRTSHKYEVPKISSSLCFPAKLFPISVHKFCKELPY